MVARVVKGRKMEIPTEFGGGVRVLRGGGTLSDTRLWSGPTTTIVRLPTLRSSTPEGMSPGFLPSARPVYSCALLRGSYSVLP